MDIEEFRKKYNTPAHKLLERGGKRDYPPVGKVVDAEEGMIGQMAGGNILPNNKAVGRAKEEYKTAIGGLPGEVRERIVSPEGIDQDIDAIDEGLRREMSPHYPGDRGQPQGKGR